MNQRVKSQYVYVPTDSAGVFHYYNRQLSWNNKRDRAGGGVILPKQLTSK